MTFGVESTIRFQFKDVCQQKHDVFIVLKSYYIGESGQFPSLYKALNRDHQLRNSCNNITIILWDHHVKWNVISMWSTNADREIEEYFASQAKRCKYI